MPAARLSTVVAPRTARGEAARARLKDAGRRVLNRIAYGQVRVADVTAEAGVAAGLFYRYFPDLRTLVEELLDEVAARFEAIRGVGEDGDPVFERLRTYHLLMVRNYAEHPGLMRAWPLLAQESPAFRKRARATYQRNLEFLVTGVSTARPAARSTKRSELMMLAHALSGLAQACLFEHYVWENSVLAAWNLSYEETAEWLSLLFYRALTGHDPNPGVLHFHDRLASLPALDMLASPPP